MFHQVAYNKVTLPPPLKKNIKYGNACSISANLDLSDHCPQTNKVTHIFWLLNLSNKKQNKTK